jgi:class 3 adenylate cyclase/tetratricopeptide (TPR) repeat protein
MRSCSSCGSEVLESATFCPTCGAPLARPCPACGSPVSPSALFCPTCGTALAPGGPAREEERKLVTVLFADVTGSTALGERLDPERLRALLTAYFAAMSAVIESWGGTVEKFIGDAIMAAFGVPIVREDDPERALRAGLDMLSRLDDLNRDFEQRHGVTLQIRIGINTGDVIAPVGGPVEQMIVSGDAVNVAARLEQSAEPDTVLVGERTYLATRNAFRFEPPVAMELKGKAGAVSAWRLVEALPETTRGVPGLRSEMVGRDRELDALLSLLAEAAETRRPRLVRVSGPAGIGKSRLVQEFLRAASDKYPELTVLSGRCLAVGHGITYWALGEILRGATGIGLDDPADVAAEKLRSGVRPLLYGLDLRSEDIEQTVFALAFTAGLLLPDNPLDGMEPRAVADELSRAWPRFATAYASTGPAVFAVEDLHWAEDQLLDMLERLLARSSGALLLLTTARPEFSDTHAQFASGRDDASSISLRPLTEQQSTQLVEGLLTVADLPSSLREEMLAKAEGNPFFLEEIIRRLIDEGAIAREGDRWRATDLARGIVLPDTVHALLAARIDALPREEKRALQEAAVVGRVFWEQPVTRAIGNGGVSDALLRLERRGLVFAHSTSSIVGQVEFAFKHALVRDVAYASLPKSRRARAHAEHGAWIEELAGERVDEFAELIAHHYWTAVAGEDADLAWGDDLVSRGEIGRKAYQALLRAGVMAKKRGGFVKAVELHEQALELAQSDRDRVGALEELGDDHASIYHGDEAVDAYRRAIALLRDEGSQPDDLARICSKAARMIVGKGGAFRVQPDPAEADELIATGLRSVRDVKTRAWLLILFGTCAMYWRSFVVTPGQAGDPLPLDERIRTAEEGLALAEQIGQADLHSSALLHVGELYESRGSYRLTVEVSRRQLGLVDRVSSPTDRALLLFEVSVRLSDLASEYEEALQLARRSYDVAKGLSAHDLMHSTHAQIIALYRLGRWTGLLPVLEEHMSVFDQERDVLCFAVRGAPFVGALALAHRGDSDRALALAEIARVDPERSRIGLDTLYAGVLIACGDMDAGRAMAESAFSRDRAANKTEPWDRPLLGVIEARVATKDFAGLRDILPLGRRLDEIPFVHTVCDRAEGLVLADAGDTASGVALIRAALRGFEAIRDPFESARTREMLAGLIPVEDREALLADALAAYEGIGARPHAERVRRELEGDRPEGGAR